MKGSDQIVEEEENKASIIDKTADDLRLSQIIHDSENTKGEKIDFWNYLNNDRFLCLQPHQDLYQAFTG